MLRLDETFHNPVKQLLKENKKVLGAWLQMASPHAPNDPLTLLEQLRAMGRFDAVPFARAPWNDLVTIKRMLDVGLYGLLIPYVNTKQEAENAVRACKYPPQGMRGIAPSPRAGGFGMNAQNYLAHANDEIVVMTAVETGAAVENLDEILEVDGLDGIFIGPMDLATSMGHFCDPSAPEVQQAIRTIEQKVFASGKFLATVAGSFDKAKDLYDKGYSMVVAFADGGTLGRVAREQVDRFHAAYPDR